MTAPALETEDEFQRFGAAQGVIASRLLMRHFIDDSASMPSDFETEAFAADFRSGFFGDLKSNLQANGASPTEADTCVAAAIIVHAATLVEVRAIFSTYPLPPLADRRSRRRRLRNLCDVIGQKIIAAAPRGYPYWPPKQVPARAARERRRSR